MNLNRQQLTVYGVWLARLVIGGLFLVSAGAKLISLGQFELTMIQQHLVNDRLTAAYLARGFVILEMTIGLCFFQRNFLKRLIIPLTVAILIGFTVYLLYLQLFTDFRENCGCFGNLVRMTPLESIIKNIAILAVLAILYRLQPADPLPRRWKILGVIFVGSAVLVVVMFPIRLVQLDEVHDPSAAIEKSASGNPPAETPPSRFALFERQAPANSRFAPTKGICLTAFLSLSCDHCRDVTTELGELQRESSVALYGVFLGEPNEVAEFFSATGTEFPYVLAAPEQFYDYIGAAPPRVYLLNNGAITSYWDMENFSIPEIRRRLQISEKP